MSLRERLHSVGVALAVGGGLIVVASIPSLFSMVLHAVLFGPH